MDRLLSWIVPASASASPGWYMAAALGATLLTGFSKGGFGGGLGVVSTPLLLLVLPANVAVSLFLPVLIACDLATLRHFPRSSQWDRQALKMIAPGTVVGLVGGLGLLVLFARSTVNGDRWIRLIVGTVSIAFCVLRLLRGRLLAGSGGPPLVGRAGGVGLGFVAGIATMVAHAAGPVVDIFLLLRRLERERFVGTAARYYLTFNTVKIPFYLAASLLAERPYLTLDTFRWSLWLLPFCPLGVAAGAWLNRRISGTTFTRVIYVFLFVTGVRMLQKALGG